MAVRITREERLTESKWRLRQGDDLPRDEPAPAGEERLIGRLRVRCRHDRVPVNEIVRSRVRRQASAVSRSQVLEELDGRSRARAQCRDPEMCHVNSVMLAISKCPNPTVFQKTLALNDFYFGSEDWQYPMGHISFVGKVDADTLRAGAPAIAPG